ncbi:hypothetical protein Droror1_Dr00027415 [Drosera rotundifolia]
MKMNQKRKSMRERQSKMKMRRTTMGKHYVVLVERTTSMTSSGSAVTYARDGSMVSVSRSLRPRPNTSSNTSACHTVATNEFAEVIESHLVNSSSLELCEPLII